MNKFLGSRKSFEESKIIITGVPFDSTSSFRAGSRFAPQYIRFFSDSIETYSPYQDFDIKDIPFFDNEDVRVSPGDTKKTLEIIYNYTTYLVSVNKFPFFIGGEHLITYPMVKAIKDDNEIIVIQFDAHTDLRDEYAGLEYSHATVMKRIIELKKVKLIQLGIRSGSREEFKLAKENNFLYNLNDIEKINKLIKNKNVYITVDVDVFDPAYVPGVGNPEAGGIDFSQFLDFILKLKDFNLKGIDVVELSPEIDPTHISSIFVSKLIRELLIFVYNTIKE